MMRVVTSGTVSNVNCIGDDEGRQMVTKVEGNGWTLDIEQKWINVTSGRSTPNERWTFADGQGHDHRYDNGYPTLDFVVDAEHWCDGTEGLASHDPHWAVDESHYECKRCREVIEPAMDPPGTPKFVSGMISATLTGIRSDGVEIQMMLEEQDLALIKSEGDAGAKRLLDTASPGRIVWWQQEMGS